MFVRSSLSKTIGKAAIGFLLAGTTAAAANPTAAASAPGTPASNHGCRTWQYTVVSEGTIRGYPAGWIAGRAKPGHTVNVHAFSGPWYNGDFYNASGQLYFDEYWILSNHLRYERCW